MTKPQSEVKHLYILGRPATQVIYRGVRCPIGDIDKSRSEIQITVPRRGRLWVPFAEVIFEGHILSQVGKNKIRTTRPGGKKKATHDTANVIRLASVS